MSEKLSGHERGRRDFLKVGGVATAALLTPSAFAVTPNKSLPALPSNPVTMKAMPTRNLGKTGYKVGIFSLGGQAALEHANNFDNAVPIIERALDMGVNYIDTSSIYGGPPRWSEQYVGKVMAKRRNEAFLATKTKERTRDDSMRMIEKSLELLQTDHVDLWQLHDVGTMYAADLNPAAIEHVRKLSASLGTSLPAENFQVAPIEQMPFPEACMDAVVCSAVLHFARDEDHFRAMLSELWRVLRPGGLLFCRLSSRIGMDFPRLQGGLFQMPDGEQWFLVDEDMLLDLTDELNAVLVDPLKTTIVQDHRCMTTWVLRKRTT